MKCPNCHAENTDDTRFCGQCGRPLTAAGEPVYGATLSYQSPTMRLSRGTVFAGRYEVIEELGQGGMGTVYKAYDAKVRETVALKILRPEIAADGETVERFRNEIKLARQISQRHVCRMYDLGEENLTTYITMEYVPGEDLKSFVRRSGHLTESKAVHLGRQIGEGLMEAHRLGVVHRDLKPQNIMIDREGNAKIMDFGIARSVKGKSLTGTGVVVGTPEYMSPEQAEARPVDARTDIYSLGVMLYEAVTGRVPFEGDTPLSIAIKHKSEPPRDPRDANPQLSPGFSQIILRCLAKSPAARYQKAEDVLADLARAAQGLPATPAPRTRRKPITEKEITVKFRVKRLLPIGAAIAVLAIGAFVLTRPGGAPPEEGPLSGSGLQVRTAPGPIVPDLYTASPEMYRLPKSAAAWEGAETSEVHKVWTFIRPFLQDSSKYISDKDLQEVEKTIDGLRAKLPADSPILSTWDQVKARILEGQKLRQEGKVQESQKTYTRGESEMRKMLTMVSERERADRSRAAMEGSRTKAQAATAAGGQNLLFWIAAEKEKDAAAAYAGSDYAGARILYAIVDRVYLLSTKGGDADACLLTLQKLVAGVKAEVDKGGPQARDSWLYESAVEKEGQAREYVQSGYHPQAAEFFILSAFLYEKAKDVAVEAQGLER